MSIQQHTRSSHQGPKHLSNEIVDRILAICDQDPKKQDLGTIVRIMVNTGIRMRELRDLR
jgi:integrase